MNAIAIPTNAAPTNAAPTSATLTEFLPLVHGIVAQFMRKLPRSVQRDDLVAAGTVGLFHAMRSSTHTCPEMFASYARIRIRGSIVDELRRHDWSPRRRKPAAGCATVTVLRPSAPPPAPAPAPARVNVVGFDDLPPAVGGSLAEDGASPFDAIEQKSSFAALHAALKELPARERAILEMRYFDELASKAIATALGLSEARISQLHARATSRLRDILVDNEGDAGLELAA